MIRYTRTDGKRRYTRTDGKRRYNLNLYCNYTFLIDLVSNQAENCKCIGKFDLIQQDSEIDFSVLSIIGMKMGGLYYPNNVIHHLHGIT